MKDFPVIRGIYAEAFKYAACGLLNISSGRFGTTSYIAITVSSG